MKAPLVEQLQGIKVAQEQGFIKRDLNTYFYLFLFLFYHGTMICMLLVIV